MTDRFEDAVRDAARDLADGSSPHPPTYHAAWRRGRRRRSLKHAGMAVAGVLVLLAALTANLGRIPGSNSTEVDEVVVGAEAAVEVATPAFVPTTPPIEAEMPAVQVMPEQDPDESDQGTGTVAAPESPAPVPSAQVDPAPTNTGAVTPQPRPTARATVPSPSTVQATPTTNDTAAPPAPEPTADPAAAGPAPEQDQLPPEPTQEPTPEPTIEPFLVEPTADPRSANDPDPDAAGTSTGTGVVPQGVPDPSTSPGAPADAALVGPVIEGVAPCLLTDGSSGEVNCELLADYPCASAAEARLSFQAIDVDGDGVIETCLVIPGTPQCDTTGDGLGDTPCRIDEPSSEPIDG